MNCCAITTGSKNAATILPRAEIPKGVERVNLFPGEGALDVGGLFHGSTVSPVFRRAAKQSGIKISVFGMSVGRQSTGKTTHSTQVGR